MEGLSILDERQQQGGIMSLFRVEQTGAGTGRITHWQFINAGGFDQVLFYGAGWKSE